MFCTNSTCSYILRILPVVFGFHLRDYHSLRSRFPSCSIILLHTIYSPQPRMYFYNRFSLFRFRSPLLAESRLISFPLPTQMFQFRRFPLHTYVFSMQSLCFTQWGFPIRIPADQGLFAAPRSFSQLVASFFGFRCQGIHPVLFLA